jgi:hypothetical protein
MNGPGMGYMRGGWGGARPIVLALENEDEDDSISSWRVAGASSPGAPVRYLGNFSGSEEKA